MSHTSQGMWFSHLPISSSLFSPFASWVFWAAYLHPLAKSHVIRGHGGAAFGLLHAHTIPACVSSPLLSHILKTCPYLLLRVLNLNLFLLFIAFACLKNRPPCSTLSLMLQLLEMCYLKCNMKLPTVKQMFVLWRRFRCMLVFPGIFLKWTQPVMSQRWCIHRFLNDFDV